MITVVNDKRTVDARKVDVEFDGRWVLLYGREQHGSEGTWCVAAYGDGTPEDRNALGDLCFDRFDGKALLRKGFTPKTEDFTAYGIYDC